MSENAGWSSSVARRAHNPKVVGSNPAPATKLKSAMHLLWEKGRTPYGVCMALFFFAYVSTYIQINNNPLSVCDFKILLIVQLI